MGSVPIPNIPDPTADLHWSDFKGPIHEIFAANARKHPDRACVVETATSKTPERRFTYKQIFEATSVLSHHFVQHGVQRGEVVMIFAHRGVDLVVAIMAVLAAGATFSVLDPLYPPDRQCIYLEVSQPRALVVIDKATREAGPLSDQVREYMAQNLDLRTEVPALQLKDDGTLVGGAKDGKDCLDDQQKLKADLPGVLVGPDSTPTLSFTSGSEGRPKGVKGRHFSLTHYFPWMAETFGLSDKDKFTMLSGIAHDPIQRDIFTPLFLGAQLLVPSKEDIQHEKLAEWMRKYGATVTHLTPAMGQILVGGASAIFPSLHHSFFVGDLLIKRDCRRLQDLAPNVRIVNMYGTTETQRAVSYYELPSRSEAPEFLDALGEVIPAGRGMNNVQLLVVDREDRNRICEPGQSGEIYVRAGGLAEEYLGLPDQTATKFVENWFVDPKRWVEEDNKKVEAQGEPEPWRQFWNGPRDRLYRSGDLGHYGADGNVHCTGRVDNQVKVRGFRIELGEIDSHLAAHGLVRENVTLLRRDAYEEPTLVSYIVPEMKRWFQWLQERGATESVTEDTSMVALLKRFKYLRDDVREHLKKKLPAYAVPSVIVPLIRFPLNPNGKIDRPALPFPEPAQLAAAGARRPSQLGKTLTATEKTMAGIWAELLGDRGVTAEGISGSDSFFDLGGHSIIAQQLLFKIRQQWKDIDVPMNTIFQYPTLRGFSSSIDQALDPIGLRLDNQEAIDDEPEDEDYSADARDLAKQLTGFKTKEPLKPGQEVHTFLTGATGFLGAYVLRDLLARNGTVTILVRAKDADAGLGRIQQTCQAYGIWDDSWTNRLEAVVGDLEKTNFGLSPDTWNKLADSVDVVIHNGALVHWVLPYSRLRAPNVVSTVTALSLCAIGKPKNFSLVSSTSVLDSEHYVELSEKSVAKGGTGVPESDDLEGSRKGLGTGYGQSKWAAEYLTRQAGKKGLAGCVIRPGYVTGDPETGTTNTDDFLVRMLKGCIQLKSRPDITNTINMVPVTHVARVVVASSFNPPAPPLAVAQITSHPRITVNTFLGSLEKYGYTVPQVDYAQWKKNMEAYVADRSGTKEEHALLPLYHFVTGDLPADTKAPELDDRNAAEALRKDKELTGQDWSAGGKVDEQMVGVYVSYLIELGFMPRPEGKVDRELPAVRLTEGMREGMKKVGGRRGV
ncbi:large subunit of L-aminoadipate-semialdehyde dehydrogenase [Trematosphaeria pertusa]|uniref:Alpha-aminoadipate reductase n=1 Tax=Trematosphaeria pertusa TaxID=390896 RepID=A0A6A6J5T1_9PLEO|nr:large subunit of L-aminoadipate-semialdehyde dehydrogenase [Trematosphaeria pertusa]KAF2257250.1 large subunit of L-aminoadipate-semialdehyde dehydrogenase [Trematosphaeria pertusa]